MLDHSPSALSPESSVEFGIFFVEPPSGRRLAYVKPRPGENRLGGTSILYDGTSTGPKRGMLEIYGGKLTEIVVETISASVEETCGLMATAPDRAARLQLSADLYVRGTYHED